MLLILRPELREDAKIKLMGKMRQIYPALLISGAVLLLLTALVVSLLFGGSSLPSATATEANPTESISAGPATPSATPEIPEPTASPEIEPALPLANIRVVLDPGHNGGNAGARTQINARVPDGRGGYKACNTTGTSTNRGYTEHEFTWDVALRAQAELESRGAEVILTRDSDDGVGPCVDERGTFADEVGADLLVSIHANGSTDPSIRGYFAIISSPPLTVSQGAPSRNLAKFLLEALDEAGFTPSNSYPEQISERSDIAGVNYPEVPAVLLELGEMRNAEEAAVMESEAGRARYAAAIAQGLEHWYLANNEVPGE